MFFTKAGKRMAALLVVAGVAAIVIGLTSRLGGEANPMAGLLSGRIAGTLVKAGTEWLVLGLALGILAEIRQAILARAPRSMPEVSQA